MSNTHATSVYFVARSRMLALLLSISFIGCENRNETLISRRDSAAPEAGAKATERETAVRVFTGFQDRFRSSPSCLVRMTVTNSLGIGPANVAFGWTKPDSLYVHTTAAHGNPSVWSLLDAEGLLIVEQFESAEMLPGRRRSIRVRNFRQVAGDGPEAPFELARIGAGVFDPIGELGMDLFDLILAIDPRQASVQSSAAEHILILDATRVDARVVRMHVQESATSAVVEFVISRDTDQLVSIRLRPDTQTYPDAVVSAQFSSIDFSHNPLEFSIPPVGESVELMISSAEDLNADLIYEVPFQSP